MTPPNVLGAPKPTSSVMISNMFGASFGGTTRGGQYGLESLASKLMTPPKGGRWDGRHVPLIVLVALGEPGTPLICWASTGAAASRKNRPAKDDPRPLRLCFRVSEAFKFLVILRLALETGPCGTADTRKPIGSGPRRFAPTMRVRGQDANLSRRKAAFCA